MQAQKQGCQQVPETEEPGERRGCGCRKEKRKKMYNNEFFSEQKRNNVAKTGRKSYIKRSKAVKINSKGTWKRKKTYWKWYN